MQRSSSWGIEIDGIEKQIETYAPDGSRRELAVFHHTDPSIAYSRPERSRNSLSTFVQISKTLFSSGWTNWHNP
jgi:hypothetical protein